MDRDSSCARAGHDGDQQLPLGVKGVNVFFLEVHLHALFLQLPHRSKAVIDTYGPAIKDIIHEQGGNAIMSAIDFGLDVDVTEDAEGNHRVIIKFDGKLLPYAKKGKYPW